jgi:hypothetical protein
MVARIPVPLPAVGVWPAGHSEEPERSHLLFADGRRVHDVHHRHIGDGGTACRGGGIATAPHSRRQWDQLRMRSAMVQRGQDRGDEQCAKLVDTQSDQCWGGVFAVALGCGLYGQESVARTTRMLLGRHEGFGGADSRPRMHPWSFGDCTD